MSRAPTLGDGSAEEIERLFMVGLPHRELMECPACEGSGRIEYGEYGSYYRDGEVYEAPGVCDCDACEGTGQIEVARQA